MKRNNISRDFTWEEFEYSRIALSKGLDNNPPDEVRPAIRELVQRLLQPLRIAYGGPIYIMSGYRSPKVNRLAGGVPSSQHVKGEAADCYVPDIYKLLEILKKSELPFDQAILYTKKHMLHLSLRKQEKNRRQTEHVTSSIQTDSQEIRLHEKLGRQQIIRMEHIRFTEPDNEQRQAIQEITRIFIEEKDSLQTENHIKKVKSDSISGSKKENVVQKTEHKSIFKPIIGLLSLLILMYTFFNYVKTKRFPTN